MCVMPFLPSVVSRACAVAPGLSFGSYFVAMIENGSVSWKCMIGSGWSVVRNDPGFLISVVGDRLDPVWGVASLRLVSAMRGLYDVFFLLGFVVGGLFRCFCMF